MKFVAMFVMVFVSTAFAAEQPENEKRSVTVRMLVTAYCPCKKCCGPNAQGITASGKKVTENGGKFCAAPKRFKFGTQMSVPGYNDSAPIPVYDRGGAIKGNHIDVYFPTHQEALEWGKQYLDVTIEE